MSPSLRAESVQHWSHLVVNWDVNQWHLVIDLSIDITLGPDVGESIATMGGPSTLHSAATAAGTETTVSTDKTHLSNTTPFTSSLSTNIKTILRKQTSWKWCTTFISNFLHSNNFTLMLLFLARIQLPFFCRYIRHCWHIRHFHVWIWIFEQIFRLIFILMTKKSELDDHPFVAVFFNLHFTTPNTNTILMI